MKQRKKSIWVIPVLVTLVTLFLLKGVFLIGYVPTASMEPTIKQGNFVVGLRFYGDLEREDIIIFRHDGKLLVKRIAAAGGESVKWGETTLPVPEEAYYVLGDNVDNSNDSRYWENPFVPKEYVEGKVISLLHGSRCVFRFFCRAGCILIAFLTTNRAFPIFGFP